MAASLGEFLRQKKLFLYLNRLILQGENMHHGYYPKDVKIIDHKKAQVDMIDR